MTTTRTWRASPRGRARCLARNLILLRCQVLQAPKAPGRRGRPALPPMEGVVLLREVVWGSASLGRVEAPGGRRLVSAVDSLGISGHNALVGCRARTLGYATIVERLVICRRIAPNLPRKLEMHHVSLPKDACSPSLPLMLDPLGIWLRVRSSS